MYPKHIEISIEIILNTIFVYMQYICNFRAKVFSITIN